MRHSIATVAGIGARSGTRHGILAVLFGTIVLVPRLL
jgi:hypothetical protein